jgi:hypothetical protein
MRSKCNILLVSSFNFLCLLPVVFNLHGDYLNKEAREGFEDFKMKWHVIHTVKCADDPVLLEKEERWLID